METLEVHFHDPANGITYDTINMEFEDGVIADMERLAAAEGKDLGQVFAGLMERWAPTPRLELVDGNGGE